MRMHDSQAFRFSNESDALTRHDTPVRLATSLTRS